MKIMITAVFFERTLEALFSEESFCQRARIRIGSDGSD